jgi:hypothetical protein
MSTNLFCFWADFIRLLLLSQDNTPVLVYARFPNGKGNRDHRYHYTRWSQANKKWLDIELTGSGPWFPETINGRQEQEPHYSAGLSLDHSNPNRLVMSRLSLWSNQFEIEVWTTKNKGVSWSQKAVTTNSQYLNVRPIIPRHYSTEENDNKLLVLWMTGTYQFWTNYSTSLNYAFV